MRDGTISTIERGVQLAKSGRVKTIGELRERLTREGFDGVHAHLAGQETQKTLRALIVAAQQSSEGPSGF